MNEEVRQRNERVRHLSEICPNGGRHLHGSALLTDGSAPPRNDNVRPEYDIAWQRQEALQENGLRSSMLRSALPQRDDCVSRARSPVFDQTGQALHRAQLPGSTDGQTTRLEVQREGTSREVGERPGPDGPGETQRDGSTSRRNSAPLERDPRSPEKRHGRSSRNHRRVSRRHVTNSRGRRGNNPSSPSSSSSRSGSRDRHRGHGAPRDDGDREPTRNPDRSAQDNGGRKSENGAGDGQGPPERPTKTEPTDDPSSNKDIHPQPASATADATTAYAAGSEQRLGKYDGTTCFETFLARFETFAGYYNWQERDKRFNLSSSLDGAAAQILWDPANKGASTDEIIQLLRNRFGNTNQAERFRAELRTRRRAPGETLQHLYTEVARLISLAYPGPTNNVTKIVARDSFLDALNNNPFRVRILEKEPPDIDTALNIAVRLEAFDGHSACVEQQPQSSLEKSQRQKEHYSRVVTEEDYERSSKTPEKLSSNDLKKDSSKEWMTESRDI